MKMKQILTTILLAFIVSVSSAQVASKETTISIINTNAAASKAAYDKQSYVGNVTASQLDSLEDAATNVKIAWVNSKSFDKPALLYKISAPINAKSNTTYSNLIIDLGGKNTVGINCQGVTNVRIVNCKIINGTGFGINAYNCSNLVIDGNLISNIGFGIYVQKTVSAKVNNNQILNVNGIDTKSLGHAIQFNGVTGKGSQVNNNRIENIDGVAVHPHDMINIFKSDGLPGDSIQVIGNWIRGGQTKLWPNDNSGAAGIVVGDVGGSYQVCRNNILVNPGYVGVQAQGGNHITVDHNLIYSSVTAASLVGLSWGNYSGLSSSDVIYAYNKVKWFTIDKTTKAAVQQNYGSNSPGLTLIGNTWLGKIGGGNSDAGLDASILPAVIITMK